MYQYLQQLKRKKPSSWTSSSEAESPDTSRHSVKRLNLEPEPEEMEEGLTKIMDEMNRRFDQLQESLASKDDITKLQNELRSEIDILCEKT